MSNQIILNIDPEYSICSRGHDNGYFQTYPADLKRLEIKNQINIWSRNEYQFNILNLNYIHLFEKLEQLYLCNYVHPCLYSFNSNNIKQLYICTKCIPYSLDEIVLNKFEISKPDPNDKNNNSMVCPFSSLCGVRVFHNLEFLVIDDEHEYCVIEDEPIVLQDNNKLKKITFYGVKLTYEKEWIEYCAEHNIKLCIESITE